MTVTTADRRVQIWRDYAAYPALDLSIEDAESLLSQLDSACFDLRWLEGES